MSVIKGRKIKDWAVFTKVHVIYQNNIIFSGSNYPLKIVIKPASGIPGQPGYSSEVSANVTGNPWVLVDTFESLERAKAAVREIGGEIGLDNVRLLRVVDLHNVLYPIS